MKRCIETALNRGHFKVTEDDMRTAVAGHSNDLLRELELEIRDTFSEGALAIEEFVGAPQVLGQADVIARLSKVLNDEAGQERLLKALLWYSFLGVQLGDGSEAYAYEEQYNVERLLRRAGAEGQEPLFVIHPAFRAALHVEASAA